MSTSNRASRLTKTHRVLKKHYKPGSVADRPLLEHLLYACCLEFATNDAADEAFAKLQQAYYDWNEVRVTTVSELSEVMSGLTRPNGAASRLKRTLQSVFECYYSFDLEALKKENIGKAVKQLEKLDGVSRFAIAFATQNGLNGHAIAVSADSLETLRVVGVISDEEAKKNRVPGLERAIPKSKGIEFGSLLHQLGADYGAAPFSLRVRAILLEIAPDAKQRFPKRTTKKAAESKRASVKQDKKTPADNAKDDGGKSAAARKKKAPTKKTTKKTPAAESKKKSTTKRLSKRKPR